MSESQPEQVQEQRPAPESIKFYEASAEDQRRISLTCHDCKMTLDMTISKVRVVQFCPCCGKPAEIKDRI